MTADRRDLAIRAALMPAADLVVPMDLAESIHRELVVTRQARTWPLGRAARLLPDTRLVSSVVRLAVVALLLLALALGIAIASRPQPPPGLVPGYHGDDARTGLMPGPAPTGRPGIEWSFDLAGPLESLSMPLVADGVVYVVDTRGTAVAVSSDTHLQIWRVEDLGSGRGSPVLVGPNLIMAADDGTVIALDIATGRQAWRVASGAPTVAPLASLDDAAIVGGDDGRVRAISSVDGHPLWQFDAGGPVERAPAIVDGVVYAAAVGGRISAYEPATDTIEWTAELGDGEVSTPAIDGGVLYVTHGPLDLLRAHELIAIDTTSGQVIHRWASPTNDRVFVGAVVDGSVYTVGEDGAVRVIDTRDAAPALILVTQLDSPIDALATVVGTTLYVAPTGGQVVAIDLTTGDVAWSVSVSGAPTMPVVVDGRVIVGTKVGKLLSLADPPTP